MLYAIVDAINAEDLRKAKGVVSLKVIEENGPAQCPVVKIGVKSKTILEKLGYDDGSYELA